MSFKINGVQEEIIWVQEVKAISKLYCEGNFCFALISV